MNKYLLIVLILFGLRSEAQYPADINECPKLAWRIQFPQSFFGSPIIHKNLLFAGCIDSNLYALNLNGQVQWKYKTNGDIRSNPSFADGQIFVVSGDGCLYCIDENTHKLIWKFGGQGDKKYPLYSFADYFQSSPLVDGEMVYFGSGDSYIYAVDKRAGSLRWKFKTGDIVHASPAADSSRVYVGSFDGYFYALKKNTGELLWKFKSVGQHFFPKGEMQGSPLVHGHKIFVGSRDYNIYSLNDSLGYCEWNRKFEKGWALTTPVYKGQSVYIGTSDDHLLLSIDDFNHSFHWETDLKSNIFGAPALSDSKLYVGTLMGRLLCLDQKSGKIHWIVNSEGYEKFRNDYFKSDDSFRDDIGKIVSTPEQYNTYMHKLGSIFCQPVVTDNSIIITTVAGEIICFKK